MNELNLETLIMKNPVVAAVRNDTEIKSVLKSSASIVFILYGSILNIEEICEKLRLNGKHFFIHIDMIDGLKGDDKAIEYLKEKVNPLGIITTRQASIKYAKKLGMFTILRIFAIDSLSLKTGAKNVNTVKPSGVEVMPGVSKKIINELKNLIGVPIIAGGLITEKIEIMDALSSGAIGVSTSNVELWNLNRE